MFSIILDFLVALFVARLIFWIARLFLTSGPPDGDARGGGGTGDATWGSDAGREDQSGRGDQGGRGRQSSIDRSSAIDVPFTEIPPEGDR